jgi:hypothetical protein
MACFFELSPPYKRQNAMEIFVFMAFCRLYGEVQYYMTIILPSLQCHNANAFLLQFLTIYK